MSVVDMERLQRMLGRMKLLGLENGMRDRLDRCCHGGRVDERLPFFYRLERPRWSSMIR